MNWHVAALVALFIVACVARAHRDAGRRAWPAWHVALTGSRQSLLQWMRLNTRIHLQTLDGTIRVAREDHALGHPADALRVIDQADALAARHVRWVRAWLERWSDVAVVLTNLAPTPPLPASPGRLPPLRKLALAQRVSQVVLPTRALRFKATVRIQRLGLKLAAWNSAAATLRARRTSQIDTALDDLEATCTDLVALDAHATTTFEQLLRSLPEDKLAH